MGDGDAGALKSTLLLALLTALLPSTLAGGARQVTASSAVLTTPHFAFYSDFAVNLNDALVVDVIASRDGRPGLFATGAEKACFDALPQASRAGWARATEYYRANRSTPAQLLLLRLELGGLVQRELLPAGPGRQLLEAFATARSDADAAYRQCLWPSQDATNRAWIAGLQPLLSTSCIRPTSSSWARRCGDRSIGLARHTAVRLRAEAVQRPLP